MAAFLVTLNTAFLTVAQAPNESATVRLVLPKGALLCAALTSHSRVPASKASVSMIGDNSANGAQLSVGLFGLGRSPFNRKVGRVHWETVRDYKPRVYDGKIVLFVAQQHAHGFTAAGNHDVTLGGGLRTTQRVEVCLTNGAHADFPQRSELHVVNTSLGVGLAPAARSIASVYVGATRSMNVVPQPSPRGVRSTTETRFLRMDIHYETSQTRTEVKPEDSQGIGISSSPYVI